MVYNVLSFSSCFVGCCTFPIARIDEYPCCFHTECAHTNTNTRTHTRSTADCNICIQRKSVQCFFPTYFLPILFHFHEKKGTIFCTLKGKSYNVKTKKKTEQPQKQQHQQQRHKLKKGDEKNVCHTCVKKNSLRIRFWLRCKNLTPEKGEEKVSKKMWHATLNRNKCNSPGSIVLLHLTYKMNQIKSNEMKWKREK